MDINTKKNLYKGGIALSVIGYGYGVYHLPKLDGHFKHEGLYVVGALVGGAVSVLSGVNIGDSAVYVNPIRPVLGIGLLSTSVGYLAARNFGASPKSSLVIGGVLALGCLYFLDKNDLYSVIGINQNEPVYKSGKDSVGASAPIQPTK